MQICRVADVHSQTIPLPPQNGNRTFLPLPSVCIRSFICGAIGSPPCSLCHNIHRPMYTFMCIYRCLICRYVDKDIPISVTYWLVYLPTYRTTSHLQIYIHILLRHISPSLLKLWRSSTINLNQVYITYLHLQLYLSLLVLALSYLLYTDIYILTYLQTYKHPYFKLLAHSFIHYLLTTYSLLTTYAILYL